MFSVVKFLLARSLVEVIMVTQGTYLNHLFALFSFIGIFHAVWLYEKHNYKNKTCEQSCQKKRSNKVNL